MNFEKDQYYSPGKKCSICLKWSGEILSSKNGVNVVSCSECGLFYVDAIPLTDEEREVQNRLAAEHGPIYLHEVYDDKTHNWQQYYLGWLQEIKKYTSGRRLLDIGCGTGQLVKAAHSTGWDAYGLDTSSETIFYGKRIFDLQDRLMDGYLEDIHFSKCFDVITLFSVIEHVEDPYKFIKQIYTLLCPVGIILIKTPSQSSLITKLHWGLHRLSNGIYDLDLYDREHIYRFSPQTLGKLLENSGFQLKVCVPDDHLWITSTRYLLYQRFRVLKFAVIAGVITAGKLLSMENQFVIIAQKKDIT